MKKEDLRKCIIVNDKDPFHNRRFRFHKWMHDLHVEGGKSIAVALLECDDENCHIDNIGKLFNFHAFEIKFID